MDPHAGRQKAATTATSRCHACAPNFVSITRHYTMGIRCTTGMTFHGMGEGSGTARVARLDRAYADPALLQHLSYKGVVAHGRRDHHILSLSLWPAAGERHGPGRRPVRVGLLASPAAAALIATFVQGVTSAAAAVPNKDVLDFFAVVKKYYRHKLPALQSKESATRAHARPACLGACATAHAAVAGAQQAASQALDQLADGAVVAAGDGQHALTRAVVARAALRTAERAAALPAAPRGQAAAAMRNERLSPSLTAFLQGAVMPGRPTSTACGKMEA
eukprot:366393-Chlamydomonas_euryale.AAC.9